MKIDLREIGWECVDWIHLVQCEDKYRGLINKILYFRDQKNSRKFLTRVGTVVPEGRLCTLQFYRFLRLSFVPVCRDSRHKS
jgi:hypothetical protein